MKILRNLLKNTMFIHFLVVLGFFSLWGYIETQNQYLLLGMYLSVLGSICGSLIKLVDLLKKPYEKYTTP